MQKFSSLFRKEDWWAVWIGLLILLLGVFEALPVLPAIAKWKVLAGSFPVDAIGATVWLLVFLTAISLMAILWIKDTMKIRQFILGFVIVFCLSLIAMWAGKFVVFTQYGLETVFWALIIGLLISNLVKIPEWLKQNIHTEFFIKTGLVLLGAEILFSTIVKGGIIGMGQALIVVLAVWFFAYWLGRKFGMGPTFASTMASGVSICGVSAAIASGGAVKGNPKETSYVISVVLLLAMPMLIAMPFVAKTLGLTPAVAGAWIGGTIDTTGAVVAAGTLVDPKTGLQVASLVKMAQNVFIGFAAFFLAIWATMGNKSGDKTSPMEIWYRFPKFILGFVLASVIFSFVVEPILGTKETSTVLAVTKGYREWFFVLAFVCIGLETRFKDLVAVGKGKPLAAFCIAQAFNVVITFGIVWLLWSGILFEVPV